MHSRHWLSLPSLSLGRCVTLSDSLASCRVALHSGSTHSHFLPPSTAPCAQVLPPTGEQWIPPLPPNVTDRVVKFVFELYRTRVYVCTLVTKEHYLYTGQQKKVGQKRTRDLIATTIHKRSTRKFLQTLINTASQPHSHNTLVCSLYCSLSWSSSDSSLSYHVLCVQEA